MCVKDKKCNGWISLHSLGLKEDGCIRDSNWLNNIVIPCSQSIIDQNVYISTPTIGLKCLKTVAHGSFGSIDYGVLETRKDMKNRESKHVYIKKPIIQGKSLLYEACIQILVNKHLASIGFPTGAPKVLSIFSLLDGSVCFAMEPIDNAITLSELLRTVDKSSMSEIIIDCLLQVCAMIWYLETVIGMNHRDLKPSNFLVREHESIKKVIAVEDEILEINSKYSITFIDFGFSCIGSPDTLVADISLSTVYGKNDPCPKNGRDMYLFISFLYIEFLSKLPKDLVELFEKWLFIPKSDIVPFLRKHGMNSKDWIYFITGNTNIKKFNCCAYRIIKDLNRFLNI